MAWLRVAAVNTSSAHAFPLGLAATRDGSTERLQLRTEHGGLTLRWTAGDHPQLSVVSVELEPTGEADSRGFAEDLGAWLDVEADGPDPRTFAPADVSLVSLGRGREGSGVEWEGHKLFLSAPERDPGEGDGLYAEIFLRVSADREHAQLVEKWSAYRVRLPALLELALGLAPRRWTPVRPRVDGLRPGEEAFEIQGVAAFAVPSGWTRAPGEGSLKVIDPTDEFGFEVSLPLAPPDTGLAELLAQVMEGTQAIVSPPAPLPHSTLEAACGETVWEETDPHHPGDPTLREARCRWLLARRSGRVVFLTFTWWTDDAGLAVPHWERAVETLTIRR